MMTPVGSSTNKTLFMLCSAEVFVRTLLVTFNLMKLMVEFNMYSLT